MPATIHSVTTRGFSNGTFVGSAALVAAMGYGLGEAVLVGTPPTITDAVDFRFTQSDYVAFAFTQADEVDFPHTQSDAITFGD